MDGRACTPSSGSPAASETLRRTPAEILEAATLNAARAFGLEPDADTIEAGKFANLLVLDKPVLDSGLHVWSDEARGVMRYVPS